MRRRQFPTMPPPVESDSVQAAKAISNAINQGLPGTQFCNLMHVMSGANVKRAAGLTLEELVAWFQEDPEAARILKACPTFGQFARDFHARARELYPPALT